MRKAAEEKRFKKGVDSDTKTQEWECCFCDTSMCSPYGSGLKGHFLVGKYQGVAQRSFCIPKPGRERQFKAFMEKVKAWTAAQKAKDKQEAAVQHELRGDHSSTKASAMKSQTSTFHRGIKRRKNWCTMP